MTKSLDATGKILKNNVPVFILEEKRIIPGTIVYEKSMTRYKCVANTETCKVLLNKGINEAVFIDYADAEAVLLADKNKNFAFVK